MNTPDPDSVIAVVGMACRLPGAATPSEFWTNLREGRESLTTLSAEDLASADLPRSVVEHPDFVPRAMLLEGVEKFDAEFFGINPRDAAIMDPQHRHFLEVTWEALESAGCDPLATDHSIGVFAGSGYNGYLPAHLLSNPDLVDDVGFFLLRHTSNDKDFLATRVSYEFDLKGPSVNVQTACSTSLVAVHLATSSLLGYECDVALAGGVTIDLSTRFGYRYLEDEILSPDGHCRPFDASAGGTIFGSGAGVVVLKRLSDAIEDGNTVLAVLRGSAVNNDGSGKVSYLAPSVLGQASAVREALAVSGVDPETVGYIECHGTGTRMGDPIEIEALREAYGVRAGGGACRVGSVKSNIGHLDTAAGVAGLIKVIQAMRHDALPPTLHFETLNPVIPGNGVPFVVNDELREWKTGPSPRRAGVNSLGVGGTNVHLIVEEAPPRSPSPARREAQLLPLSAMTPTSVRSTAGRLAESLTAPGAVGLADAAWTLQTGRRAFPVRAAIAAASPDEAAERLRDLATRGSPVQAANPAPRLAMMFSGGGASHLEMGMGLVSTEPVYAETIERCCTIAREAHGHDLHRCFAPGGNLDAGELRRPSVGLPALFATQIACARLWEHFGVVPEAVIGHSVGEYAAAHVAGVLSLEDALSLVIHRARLFEELPPGAMLSVAASPVELEGFLSDTVEVAVRNAPDLTVLSGPTDAIDEVHEALTAQGFEAQRVHIDVAAHSAMVDPILPRFRAALDRARFSPPVVPLASNLTGEWLTNDEARDREYWVRQLRNSVRFTEGLSRVAKEHRLLLEAGPGTALTSLARMHAGLFPDLRAVNSMRHPREAIRDDVRFMQALGDLWEAGLEVDWRSVHGDDAGGRHLVPLPTYAFDHREHWVQPGRPDRSSRREAPEDWCRSSAWHRLAPTPTADPPSTVIVTGPDRDGVADALADPGLDLRLATTDQELAGLLQGADDGSPALLVTNLTGPGDSPDDLTAELLNLRRTAAAVADATIPLLGWRVVVSGAADLPGEESGISPVATALASAVRVVAAELAPLSVRCIDLPRSATGVEFPGFAAEISADGPDLVALRSSGRYERRFQGRPLASDTPEREAPATCVITGGLGDLALALARDLVSAGSKRIALVARTGLPPDSELQFHLGAGGPTARRWRAVEELRELGAEARVWEADVTDASALSTAADEIREAFGSVDLVVHTAGVLDDGLLLTRTDDQIRQVLAPKVEGATRVRRAFDAPLVLFSSTSAQLGLVGQFDYAAANGYMDGLAVSADPSESVLSVGWGVWREIGLAARLGGGGLESHPSEPMVRWRRTPDHVDYLVTGADWLIREHRTRSGVTLLPGTGHLSLLLKAIDTENSEVVDVLLQTPLVIDESRRRVVRVARDGSRIAIRSAAHADAADHADWVGEHVEASVRTIEAAPSSFDQAAIRSRCSRVETPPERRVHHAQMDFGPRWACVDQISYGADEALVELSLDPAYHDDLTEWPIHPALLDMAIGAPTGLLPDFDPESEFFVPHSYASVRVHRPMPPTILSHVRRTGASSTGCDFDVTIATAAGHLVAEIEGVRLRRMQPDVLDGLHDPTAAAPQLPDGFAASLAAGIAPAEGLPLLRRILSSGIAGHLLVSPRPIEDLRREASPPAAYESTSESPVSATERPRLSTDFVEPMNETERRIAALWSRALGIATVGVHDDFFELGGHSLVLTKLVRQIRNEVGLDLSLSRAFEMPTINGWIDSASAVRAETSKAPLRRISREGYAVKVETP